RRHTISTRDWSSDVCSSDLGRAGEVGDNRVVDHQVDGNAGFDPLRITAEARHRVAHRGEVGDRGNAGEVLHEDPRGHELELATRSEERRGGRGWRWDVSGIR